MYILLVLYVNDWVGFMFDRLRLIYDRIEYM